MKEIIVNANISNKFLSIQRLQRNFSCIRKFKRMFFYVHLEAFFRLTSHNCFGTGILLNFIFLSHNLIMKHTFLLLNGMV